MAKKQTERNTTNMLQDCLLFWVSEVFIVITSIYISIIISVDREDKGLLFLGLGGYFLFFGWRGW